MDQKDVYGQRYGTGFTNGRSKIEEARRRRAETDRIMSPLWVLSPILGSVILTIALYLAVGFVYDDAILTGAAAYIMIAVGIISWVLLIAYPWYIMIKRRTEHFKRDHLLMMGIIEYLEERQKRSDVNLTQELATLRSIASEARFKESEKNPILYTILAMVIPWFGILYVLYFLMKDIYSHHQRITFFMENTRIASNKLGDTLVIPSWHTLEKRNFVVYFLISCVCSLFMYYWMYSIIKDYNQHFKNQWRFEDQLLSDSYSSIGGKRQSISREQGAHHTEKNQPMTSYRTQTPHQQRYSQPSQKQTSRNQCPDCGGQMRFIEQYDRWYCDRCQSYKSQRSEQQMPTQQLRKSYCPDCGNKIRYIEKYDRWYCDNCRNYK